MKQIKLTQNKFALVDDEDFELIKPYKWYFNNGYAKAYHEGKRLRMHRLILNASTHLQVDHINRNSLDNRRANLRLCTVKENNRNASLRKDNTSGYKGVNLDKTTGHWKPVVYVDGKAVYFGQFKNKRYAALAYDAWITFFHGKFAATNFTSICLK